MRQVRYRAVIALDPARPGPVQARYGHGPHGHGGNRRHGPLPVPYPRSTAQTGPGALTATAVPVEAEGEEYPNHTRELMLRAESRNRPGSYRNFTAELCWDDEMPLHPGDRHVVTITVTDDEAAAFLGPGRQFTLWNGADVGHGTISRQMYSSFTEYGPF